MDGKDSKVWRFAHTYSTAKNGFWSTPRGHVSQDGRFFMFTSDWEDQLGKAPSKYRTDVFVVELGRGKIILDWKEVTAVESGPAGPSSPW